MCVATASPHPKRSAFDSSRRGDVPCVPPTPPSLGSATEDCGVSKAEYLVHSMHMEKDVESFVVCVVGKMAQDVGMV